ncbi:MAG TPA: hypothetical protein VFH31_13305 [Pyrinomonadaceae bacterium]|nr:hypothetical protein [Pyrinomonadaceae bacterium]
MPQLLSKLVNPRYPSTAIGLEKGIASMVDLGRARGNVLNVRRAATVELPSSLIQPSFDQSNIADKSELATALSEMAASAGLLRHKRWSVTLPEATTRTLILTLETRVGSQSELEEVLAWKMDRGFSVPLNELSIAREELPKDAQGRARYLAVATRATVLQEYEDVFNMLGWRAGLILPRYLGEAQWLKGNGFRGDTLLVSSSSDGFTAIVFRDQRPLILRNIRCDEQEQEDELYRLLMFYRDRRAADSAEGGQLLSGLLVTGNGFSKARVGEIVNETLGGDVRPLEAYDLGLQLPSRDLQFDAIAAPSGLATLSQ